MNKKKEIKKVRRSTYKIICVHGYEFEGRVFIKGEIGEHCFGRLVPEHWRKVTGKDINIMRLKHFKNYYIN